MLPTPSTSHVSFETVYEPAEDSFLLLDTLSKESEKSWLARRFPPSVAVPLVLEIGTGSGVVIAFVAANANTIFGRDILSLGIDINENACKATTTTVQKAMIAQSSNSVYLGSVCANLFDTVRPGIADVLIFNPPYVPTAELPLWPFAHQMADDKFRFNSHLLELSYAGGKDGMETTWRLLMALPEILSSRGVAYILLCRQNKPEDVKIALLELLEGNWIVDTVGYSGKTAGWERLEIIRIARLYTAFTS